ncbi:MAG TPA: class I SAM-dependent methyltransferase, partial [Terriglobales bacterium]|nr:class I SAM-dependent methyltransferase [Terriglobales bacterium]
MRKRTATIAIITLLVALGAFGQRPSAKATAPENEKYPPLAKTESEKRILSTISEAVKANELYLNVPAVDGRMLRLLTAAVNAKHVVEIGTSTGISGMWFCMALEKTGGKLTSFELDPHRAALAREHFKKAGVDHIA